MAVPRLFDLRSDQPFALSHSKVELYIDEIGKSIRHCSHRTGPVPRELLRERTQGAHNRSYVQSQTLKPYVGAFYRRAYVDGLPDINSTGARAGVYFSAGRNAYLGIGAVYESYIDCNESVYSSCDDIYPEVSFTIAF
jgi:hypothetical protein